MATPITAFFRPVTTSTTPEKAVSGAKRERPASEAAKTEEGASAAKRPAPSVSEAHEEAREVSAAEGIRKADATVSSKEVAAAGEGVSKLEVLSTFGIDVHSSWAHVIAKEASKPYFAKLHAFVMAARAKNKVFPPPDHVFSAFRLTPFDSIKVVILGQDPYHGPGQAHGLAFSVQKGVAFPPSLRNILEEAKNDVHIKKPTHGCLEHWAKQGVLLLNAVLTVNMGNANSHAEAGWETFTTAIIKAISDEKEGVVFMLWGKPAQTKASVVNRAKHFILEAPHPSPLSAHRGFMGCKHFSKTNEYLVKKGLEPIDWNLEPTT